MPSPPYASLFRRQGSVAGTYAPDPEAPKNRGEWMAQVGSGEVDAPHWLMPDETAFLPGQGMIGDLAATGLRKMAKVPLMGLAGITVYHGSPYKFSKFLKEKIGTGEGAQAYGHGLYFAEDPKVAGSYKRALQENIIRQNGQIVDLKKTQSWQDPIWNKAVRTYADFWGDKQAAIKSLEEQATRASKNGLRKDAEVYSNSAKYLKEETGLSFEETGSLYHVDLPDSKIEKMLDWDKPLSEQPKEIRDRITGYLSGQGGLNRVNSILSTKFESMDELRGSEVYKLLAQIRGGEMYKKSGGAIRSEPDEKWASEFLYSLGIPGIKYLDQGSRPVDIVDKNIKAAYEQFKGDVEKAADYLVGYLHDTPANKAKARKHYVDTMNKAGKQTRNFVVFNPDDVKILERK